MRQQGGVPSSSMSQGPPYPPQIWALGGAPKVGVDVPVTSVFLASFLTGAIVHMVSFQRNLKRGHKFLFNVFLFAFCMARIVTSIMRIAATCVPHNLRLAIAAQVFVAAGILIIFIINLIWAQRILRSLHPRFGWHRAVSILLTTSYILIGFTLAIVITATVQSFYTLRPRTRTIDRDLQLFASTFFASISFAPIPIILLALLIPRSTRPEKFGTGRLRTKIYILLTGTSLVCSGAAYRCGTAWLRPVPRTQPLPDYFSKACFYVFNFGVEVLVVYLYAIVRTDRRFHVPDGAKGPGSYEAQDQGERASDDVDAEVEKVEDRGVAHGGKKGRVTGGRKVLTKSKNDSSV